VLQISSIVPTSIIGTSTTERWTSPLAGLASESALCENLIALVKRFAHGDDGTSRSDEGSTSYLWSCLYFRARD
jgi:hypothetical protein